MNATSMSSQQRMHRSQHERCAALLQEIEADTGDGEISPLGFRWSNSSRGRKQGGDRPVDRYLTHGRGDRREALAPPTRKAVPACRDGYKAIEVAEL
jgi:hypothetical protein